MADHPDAAQDPPPYGWRLDNLFLQATTSSGPITGGVGGVTTFSFDPITGGDMTVTISGSSPSININIAGLAYGGVDTGGSYGFGEGLYTIDFNYRMNVVEVAGPDGGWSVSPNSALNTGTITAGAGIAGVTAGTSWTLYDQSANSFLLLRDEHRLGAFPGLAALDPFVGRGWVTFNSNGNDSDGTQDFLFVAVPEPSTIFLGALGLGGVAVMRRRWL